MKTKALVKELQRQIKPDVDAHYPGQALVDWFSRGQDADLWRINAFVVAEQLEVDRGKLLATFLRLVREGVLDLSWDFHCTHVQRGCRQPPPPPGSHRRRPLPLVQRGLPQ